MNFNPVILARDSLSSQVVRNLIGQRIVDLAETYESDDEGNILTRIFNFSLKLAGFAIAVVLNFFSWSLSEIWEILVEIYFEVKYFDWNQTDAEIKRQLEANDSAIAAALGRVAGTGLVWLTGVSVSAGLTFKFPVLAGRLALELSEEGGQEIRSTLTNFLLTVRTAAIQNFLMSGLLNVRRLRLFGQEPVLTEKKPWTIAGAIDERIEQISNSRIKAFINSFGDAVEDSIIEMGYVVAYTLDDYFAGQQRANQDIFGQDRTVIVTPDTRAEDEQIIIEAPQELIVPAIQNTVNNHQLIYNRDVGQIVGLPEEDYVTPRPQRRKLRVIFKNKQQPPWRFNDGTRVKTVECNIPDVKRGLTWEKLKQGIKKFTWGRYRVTGFLANGRQMTIYGVSEAEAETQLLELAKLSDSNVIRIVAGKDIQNDPRKRKEPTLVYPAYAKLILGDIDSQGNVISRNNQSIRIDLWTDEQPEDQLLRS